MTSRKSLSKRKYDAIITVKDGKWFTGYEGDAELRQEYHERLLHSSWAQKACYTDAKHKTATFGIKPCSMYRGRSAAGMVFEDTDGFRYYLSMNGTSNLLQAISDGKIVLEGGYFVGEWCQVKQGCSYFIDLVEE